MNAMKEFFNQMIEKPDWIDDYGKIIDDVRQELIKLEVKEEQTFEYAFIRVFSRAVLTMCEIYTLISAGYPEGALALSRQSYEAIVVLNYLSSKRDDLELIERFFADVQLSALKVTKSRKEYSGQSTDDEEKGLTELRQRYPDFCDKNGDFKDYWWVEKNCSFTNLTRKTQFSKNYMYIRTSKTVHVSLVNALCYSGQRETGILIGETYDGVEEPAWFSMLNFCVAMDLFQNVVQVNLNNIIEKAKLFIDNIKSKI